MTNIYILVLLGFSFIATSSSALKDGAPAQQCVAMSAITTLALENTKTTTRLRTGNVPKLQCVGNCPSDAAVSSVHCTRQGMDDLGNPTWRCVPEFAISSQVTKRVYGLNNVRVQCEGCTKRGDPDVTAGSCVVQYGISEIGRINPHRGARGAHNNDGDAIGLIFFCIFTLAMIYILMKACKTSRRHAAEESVYAGGAYPGIPLDAKGNPIHNGHQAQHHHHHHGGGGFGGGGFGTGMLTGFLVGDAMSHMHHGGGGYGGGGGYDDGGGYGGGGGFGDGGGFGGTDFV